MRSKNSGKHVIVWALLAALALGAGVFWLRHGVLEAGLLPRDCAAPGSPLGLCLAKDALIQTFLHQRIGWLSLAFGVLAFVRDSPRLAWVAWLSGVAGLVLYSYDPAAVGALLALLVLVRAHEQHRQGQRQSGQQPGDGLGVGHLR
ncbi:MAG TPA: hypothetical protein PLF79_02985 [Thauera sp.]|uniref:hypothetical protein n=1 Tax=Thauera sp. TaxID=1905334 RepID=UPI002C7994EC|nr:hypothetical protein [Thauera sp.]HRP25013.1 hypothetical protein [Thauera sp.]HRP65005.1 hypothetical protein [Thauera sp.]